MAKGKVLLEKFGLWDHRASLRSASVNSKNAYKQLYLEFHTGQLDLASLRQHILKKIEQKGALGEEVEKNAKKNNIPISRVLGDERGFDLGVFQDNANHSQVNPENAFIQVERNGQPDPAGLELLECLKKALKKPE